MSDPRYTAADRFIEHRYDWPEDKTKLVWPDFNFGHLISDLHSAFLAGWDATKKAQGVSSADSSFDNSAATKAGMETHGDLAFIFADGALWQHMQSRLSPTDSGFHPGTDEALHRTEIAQFEIEVAELTTERDALKAEVETANANAFHLELKHNEVAKELKACREAYEAARDRARGCIQAGYDHMGKTYLGIAAVTEFETQLAAIFAQYDTSQKP